MTLSTSLGLARSDRQTRNAQDRRRRFRPLLELLEDRRLLSTFWVTNTNDDGLGSLRLAVTLANLKAGADVIQFREAAKGTITLSSQLTITGDTTIKGLGADEL